MATFPPNSQPSWQNPAGSGSSPRAIEWIRKYNYFNYNGVLYREKAQGSPTFSFDKEGNSRCGREFFIPWTGPDFDDPTAIWTAAKTFLGYPTIECPQPNGFPIAQDGTATIINGSMNITMGSNSFANLLKVGQTIVGTGIPAGTVVTSAPNTTPPSGAPTLVTISNAATTSGTFSFWFGVQPTNLNGTLTSSTTVTDLSITNALVVGEAVSGPGIPSGTTVSAVKQGSGCVLSLHTDANGTISGFNSVAAGGTLFPPSAATINLSILSTGARGGIVQVVTDATGTVTGVGAGGVVAAGSGYPASHTQTYQTSSVVTLSQAATITATNSPLVFGQYKYISRNLPHSMENFAQFNFPNFLYATSIGRLEGTIPDGYDIYETGQSWEGLLSLIYSSTPYNILSDQFIANLNGGIVDESLLLRYVTAQVNPAGKWQTIPSYSALQYQPGPFTETNPNGPGTITYQLTSAGPVANQAAVFLPHEDITIDWYEVPLSAIPWGVIRRAQGCTNIYPFGGNPDPNNPLSVIGQKAPGTVVFLSPKITLKKMITGELGATISYTAKHFPNGVNSIYNIYRNTSDGFIPGFQPTARNATLAFQCTTTNGQATLTGLPANAKGLLRVGMSISGMNITDGTTVSAINQTSANANVTVTMSANASAGGSVSLSFGSAVYSGPLLPYSDLNMLFRPQQSAYDL